MGKGSNVQKAQMARERNQKNIGKSDEERRAALAKARQDSVAFVCGICKQSFMVNARPPTLYLHVTAKHDGINPTECFPSLAGYDPNDSNGEKKAAQEKAAAEARAQRASARKAATGGGALDDLLSAGISKMRKSAKF